MTTDETHRIGLVRAAPDFWQCLCGEGLEVKPRSLKVCADCGARESERPDATWDEAAGAYLENTSEVKKSCSTHK